LQKRSLFKKIFGRDTPPIESNHTRMELLSSSNATFIPFDGNIFNNDIVRSALRPKANAIGKLSGKHIVGYDDKMKINSNKQVVDVLKRPNPYMSMQDFLMKMTYQRELNHNAFAYIKRDVYGRAIEVYPIPYSMLELLEVNGEVFCKFRFLMGKYMVVPYVDLIHLRKDFYQNDFFGESSLSALKNIMEVITTTDQGIINAIKNSAVVKWIMKFKSVLQPKDVKLQIEEFTDNYLNVTKSGGAAASDPRYELEQVKQESYVPNAAQMKEAIQRLYSYFGVNDAIVQNKYKEDEYLAFYESEIEPILIQMSEAFTQAFFTETQRKQGNRILFESSNLAFASMTTKLKLVDMVDRGAMTPNEWRRVMNLPPIEGGNKPIRRLDTAVIDDKEVKEDDNEG
jgi:HK97 family phage portal protein